MADQNHKCVDPIEAVAIELEVSLRPRAFDLWRGTSAQLIDEGVLPSDFEFPTNTSDRSWSDGTFEYWLNRVRPAGRVEWKNVDHWVVRRTLASAPRDGFAAARLFEAKQALLDEIFSQSLDGRIRHQHMTRAYLDSAFQAFKSKIMPERKRPGRKSKGAAA